MSQGEGARFDSWQCNGAGGGRGDGEDCSFSYCYGDKNFPNNRALLVRIAPITIKPTIFFCTFKMNFIAGILW